jgi:phosphoglycerate dehydrogenase-like enzyme
VDKVNVVITAAIAGSSPFTVGIGDENFKNVSAVSSRIKLDDASILLSEEQRGDLSSKGRFDALLGQAEVLFGFRLPNDLLKRAPRLRWIQVMSAGVERFLTAEIIKSPVILTNVSGMHAVPISEWVIGVMLMFAKQMPHYLQLQREKKWQRSNSMVLQSRTVGILGLGHIGREVARLSKAFGMNVLATRRSARTTTKMRYVDQLLPRAQQGELLRESDFVVITLPFTPETKNLIGEKELRMMKPGACLINIGRGGIIDENMLIRALKENWIRGAGLDVFATEPLPPDSELWDLRNVILTPHVSGSMEDYVSRATGLFCENLKRYLDGKRLRRLVNKRTGY